MVGRRRSARMVVVGAVVLLAACGSTVQQARPIASVQAAGSAGASQLDGTWPAPTTSISTTTTTTVPAGPNDGLTVSGSIGPDWPTEFTAADAAGDEVPLFQAPNVPLPSGRVLTNPTSEGVPLVMLVRKEQGDWLHVQIQSRPNGATAWIRRADVTLRIVPNASHGCVRLSNPDITTLVGLAPQGTPVDVVA